MTNTTSSTTRKPTKAQRPIRWIAVRDLDVRWEEAQRHMNQKRVDHIAANLDPDAIGVITVSPGKDGKYHIIDGQHRVAAIKQAWGDAQQVPCQVIEEADGPAEAADIWLTVNTDRATPHSFERFGVAITAGRELECAVNEVIEASAFVLGKGGIQAVQVCISIHENQGAGALAWVLDASDQIWKAGGPAGQASILEGLAAFLKRFRYEEVDGKVHDFDDARLIKQVALRYVPSRLIGSARAARETFGGSMAVSVARVMTRAYNTRIRPENQLVF